MFKKYIVYLEVNSEYQEPLYDFLKRGSSNIKIDDLVGYFEILWDLNLDVMFERGDKSQKLMVKMTKAIKKKLNML